MLLLRSRSCGTCWTILKMTGGFQCIRTYVLLGAWKDVVQWFSYQAWIFLGSCLLRRTSSLCGYSLLHFTAALEDVYSRIQLSHCWGLCLLHLRAPTVISVPDSFAVQDSVSHPLCCVVVTHTGVQFTRGWLVHPGGILQLLFRVFKRRYQGWATTC